jgi:hypothetical protein
LSTLDAFVLEYAPGPLIDIDPALVRARAAFRPTLDALASLSDADLLYDWRWNGNPADVRYGFHRTFELLESATAAAARALADSPTNEARNAVAAATASRWALQAILARLGDDDLDTDPGNGEWTLRKTMQHIINSQRGYAWGSAAWLSLGITGDLGDTWPPQEMHEGFPEEEEEALGSLSEVRAELNDIVDVTSARYAALTEDELRVMSRWSGYPVSIAFRQWRWSSHISEHTVQIEKTLDLLGRRRSEVDWLVRLIGRAYGAFEATAFGRQSAAAATSVFDDVAGELTDLRGQLTAAARAAIPAEDW